jgi:CRISPR/Cas system CSM-associated protein Csm4 (group 5 of RAMP superfamily)
MFAKMLFLKGEDRFPDFPKSTSIIFSDFLPEGYFPKPALPPKVLGVGEDSKKKKEFKKKNFLKIGEKLEDRSFKEVKFLSKERVFKNTISRLHGKSENLYSDEIVRYRGDLSLYVAYEKSFKEKEILDTLNLIGSFGFGKKSSSGFGQFEVEKAPLESFEWEVFGKSLKNGISKPSFLQGATIGVKVEMLEKKVAELGEFPKGTPYLTLSPSIPNSGEKSFYNLYQKFGKHGADEVQIWKQHSLMADSGAVYFKE